MEQKQVPLLETRNLKKYFKVKNGFLHAVDDISLRIDQGHTLGVVGESGCGKSTLGDSPILLRRNVCQRDCRSTSQTGIYGYIPAHKSTRHFEEEFRGGISV